MPLKPAPAPGIYNNTDFDEYASWDAVNHSRLKKVEQSPLHFQQSVTEETPALVVGKAAHYALLEPDVFARRVRLAPINPKTGNAYGYETKAYYEACCAAPSGTILLSQDDLDACTAMRRAVWSHPAAKDILSEKAASEVSLVWKDPGTGLACKARGDRVSANWWVDFKTTENASPVAFAKSVAEYGYHTAQAFYDLGRSAWKITAQPVLIVAEKRPPYAVAVYEIGEETMGIARTLVGEWLAKVAACLKTKNWHGYDEGITALDAPLWYLKKFADAEV